MVIAAHQDFFNKSQTKNLSQNDQKKFETYTKHPHCSSLSDSGQKNVAVVNKKASSLHAHKIKPKANLQNELEPSRKEHFNTQCVSLISDKKNTPRRKIKKDRLPGKLILIPIRVEKSSKNWFGQTGNVIHCWWKKINDDAREDLKKHPEMQRMLDEGSILRSPYMAVPMPGSMPVPSSAPIMPLIRSVPAL